MGMCWSGWFSCWMWHFCRFPKKMLAAENLPCDAVTTVLVRPTSAYALAAYGWRPGDGARSIHWSESSEQQLNNSSFMTVTVFGASWSDVKFLSACSLYYHEDLTIKHRILSIHAWIYNYIYTQLRHIKATKKTRYEHKYLWYDYQTKNSRKWFVPIERHFNNSLGMACEIGDPWGDDSMIFPQRQMLNFQRVQIHQIAKGLWKWWKWFEFPNCISNIF